LKGEKGLGIIRDIIRGYQGREGITLRDKRRAVKKNMRDVTNCLCGMYSEKKVLRNNLYE